MKKLYCLIAMLFITASSLAAFSATNNVIEEPSDINTSEILKLFANRNSDVSEILKVNLGIKDMNVFTEPQKSNTQLTIDQKSGISFESISEKIETQDKYYINEFVYETTVKTITTVTKSPNTEFKSNKNQQDKVFISERKAIRVARESAGGGKVIKIKLNCENQVNKYEIDIHLNNYEYEIEIDAISANIISCKIDRLYG